MLVYFSILNVKYKPSENHKNIALKPMVFYFNGASKGKQKYVSWFWKFGNLALENLWKCY